jgi:hypothetical protein
MVLTGSGTAQGIGTVSLGEIIVYCEHTTYERQFRYEYEGFGD